MGMVKELLGAIETKTVTVLESATKSNAQDNVPKDDKQREEVSTIEDDLMDALLNVPPGEE